MKKFLKILRGILIAVFAVLLFVFVYVVANEYVPLSTEELEVTRDASKAYVRLDNEMSVMTWNIGYCGLGEGSDFFMDGGSSVRSASQDTVVKYMLGVKEVLRDNDPDLIMLQEVDSNSSRTYSIDERDYLTAGESVYALNYSCVFVPYPIPPIGRVNSGLYTTTDLYIDTAERISLPCPFKWPVSAANLKRCLLVSYMPIKDSTKQLVLVNLHLEAYDNGEGKIAQTQQLREFIEYEYKKGNYVIAGGDFNQIFPGGLEAYPNTHSDLWEPGTLEESILPSDDWQFAYDLSTPSCRLLNQPYDPDDTENTQYYVIDGFILSPNVELKSVQTLDEGFENSDHNPVLMSVVLKSATNTANTEDSESAAE
jgi:endonuclease/exonuclease/phosphatase family metal-dependent hydrolase